MCLLYISCFACYNFHISVLNGMTEDNKTFSFYLSKGTMLYCIVCNVLVNYVCLHALFLYVICAKSVLKALKVYVVCCYMYRI